MNALIIHNYGMQDRKSKHILFGKHIPARAGRVGKQR